MIRPFEEQTTLEKRMRALLWAPTDARNRAVAALPKLIKGGAYKEAAECQDIIAKSESDIKMWNELLGLYDNERSMVNSSDSPSPDSPSPFQKHCLEHIDEIRAACEPLPAMMFKNRIGAITVRMTQSGFDVQTVAAEDDLIDAKSIFPEQKQT